MSDSPNSQLHESSTTSSLSSAQVFKTVSSQTGVKDDRITRLECMMENIMHYVTNLGQSAGSVKDNAIAKTGMSCIQVYHSLKNDCSNRWVIPLKQIGECGNDVQTQGIQLAPLVSAGLIITDPQRERQPTNRDEIPRRSRRPISAVSSSLSVPAILFPSCASREEKRYVRYPRNHRQTHRSNMSSQGSNGESGTNQGSWKPESDTSSLLLENDSPNPSGTKPTFVAMIKTAIRDLRRYKQTSVEAISKYILLRYQVQNDILLQYLLDWMTDMDILEKKEDNYVFSSKRLVKKTTVAVIRNRKRSRSSRRRKKSKRSSKYRSRSKRRRTRRSRDAYNGKKRRRSSKKTRQTCAYESVDYNELPKRKCRQKKSKNQSKRRKKSKPRKPCTCKHELRAAKNRVKVKSRYVRRGGKIYKEEEYI